MRLLVNVKNKKVDELILNNVMSYKLSRIDNKKDKLTYFTYNNEKESIEAEKITVRKMAV